MKTIIFIFALVFFSITSWIGFSSSKSDAKIAMTALQSSKIVITGNSIVDYIAPCDQSRKTIPQLTQSIISQPIADLSKGGQSFWEAVQFIRLSQVIKPTPNVAIFAFTPAAFAISTLKTQSAQSKNLALAPISISSIKRLAYSIIATPPANMDDLPLTYKSRQFGKYNDIKSLFRIEDERAICPEGPASDSLFFEFMHWRALQKLDTSDFNFSLVMQSLSEIEIAGTKPIIVLLPMPMSELRRFGGTDTARIDFIINKMTFEASATGIQMIDLSRSGLDNHFAQKWCACGHLNETGRKMVSEEIAKHLSPFSRKL